VVHLKKKKNEALGLDYHLRAPGEEKNKKKKKKNTKRERKKDGISFPRKGGEDKAPCILRTGSSRSTLGGRGTGALSLPSGEGKKKDPLIMLLASERGTISGTRNFWLEKRKGGRHIVFLVSLFG